MKVKSETIPLLPKWTYPTSKNLSSGLSRHNGKSKLSTCKKKKTYDLILIYI